MKKTLRRTATFFLTCAMLFTLAACGATPKEEPAPSGNPESDRLTIAMCLELPNIDFYTASKAGGIDAAAADGNAEILWLGSEDVSELLSIIETQIDAGVDGICIQASNPDSLKNVIDKAAAKGIPCVVFNNTMEYAGYDGCVGMDPLVAGAGIGEKIESILLFQNAGLC